MALKQASLLSHASGYRRGDNYLIGLGIFDIEDRGATLQNFFHHRQCSDVKKLERLSVANSYIVVQCLVVRQEIFQVDQL